MSESFNIYHKIEKESNQLDRFGKNTKYILGEKSKFIGLNNSWLYGVNTLKFLNQYLEFQVANKKEGIISDKLLTPYEEERFIKMFQNIFSMDKDSYTFYNTSYIQNIKGKESKGRGFYESNDNGNLFLKTNMNSLPEVTFFLQEVEALNSSRLYSYVMMSPQEYSTFFMIRNIENMDSIFRMYMKNNPKTSPQHFSKKYEEFIFVFKDSLVNLKNNLNFLKNSKILEKIKQNSLDYNRTEFEKELPFYKESRNQIIKKEPYTEITKPFENLKTLNEVFLEQLKQEKNNFNKAVDNYIDREIPITNKTEIAKLVSLKTTYSKCIKAIENFINENQHLSPKRYREIKKFECEMSL